MKKQATTTAPTDSKAMKKGPTKDTSKQYTEDKRVLVRHEHTNHFTSRAPENKQ